MQDKDEQFRKVDVTELVNKKGFDCRECGHRHAGRALAYICIGCSCDVVPDFDRMAAEDFDAAGTAKNMNEEYDPTTDLIEIDGMMIEGGSVIRSQAEHNTEVMKRLGILTDDGDRYDFDNMCVCGNYTSFCTCYL